VNESVTIGVPVYRGQDFLAETLDSIRAQTHGNFEVLLSLDGPDPVCEALCRQYLDDARFHLTIQPERLGWVGNINWLMRQVRTDFWYFHQQDDLIAPTYLEALLGHARAHPEAALVYCDLLPMGRIEEPFSEQPPPVLGATAFIRVMTMLHEHFPAFAFRGLTRAAALRDVGSVPVNDVTNFGVDICWLTGVARSGELHHVAQPLYRKRYHGSNTESKWWALGKEPRLATWPVHCVNMLEQAMQIRASVQQHRLLWLAAVERLTSLSAAAHFLSIAELTPDDRDQLFNRFMEAAQASALLDAPARLDATWEEIGQWTRAFYWMPARELLEVVDFGPQQVRAGEPFNVQANGESAIWVRFNHPTDPGFRLRLGDTVLETTFEGDVLTAIVPAAATEKPGKLPLVAIGRWGEARSHVAAFSVIDSAEDEVMSTLSSEQ
jgi:hypothetical protein